MDVLPSFCRAACTGVMCFHGVGGCDKRDAMTSRSAISRTSTNCVCRAETSRQKGKKAVKQPPPRPQPTSEPNTKTEQDQLEARYKPHSVCAAGIQCGCFFKRLLALHDSLKLEQYLPNHLLRSSLSFHNNMGFSQ